MTRAYATTAALCWLAGFLAAAIGAAALVGHLLTERDQLIDDRRAADAREDHCVALIGDVVARTHVQRERLQAALDAEEDRACACWVAP